MPATALLLDSAQHDGTRRVPTTLKTHPDVCVAGPGCVHCCSSLKRLQHGVSPVNRREFLASAAVATSGPILLGMTRKADDPNPVIGTGEHKYQCFHNWGELPSDYAWQTTHNVAIDSAGLVYITHQGSKATKANRDTVMVFDPKGKFVRSFGKEWINGGHGIEIRKEGGEEFIYLSNTWEEPKLV